MYDMRRVELLSSQYKCLFISYYLFAAITCAQPSANSNNADITCGGSDPASLADTCTYVCNSGFRDTGSGTITCNDNLDGTGSFTTPTCARKLIYCK